MAAHWSLDIRTSPASWSAPGLDGADAIVIDVLRASCTVIEACANGVGGIVPVAEIEAARARAGEFPGALLGGERQGLRVPGFDLGNSPFEYSSDAVRGRTVILTTSNGTRAIEAARAARSIRIAAPINLTAVVDEIAANRSSRIVILCAGGWGERSLEDDLCAGMIAHGLQEAVDGLSPSAAASELLELHRGTPDPLATMRDTEHARRLVGLGAGRDVAFCTTPDTHTLVPSVVNGRIGRPERG